MQSTWQQLVHHAPTAHANDLALALTSLPKIRHVALPQATVYALGIKYSTLNPRNVTIAQHMRVIRSLCDLGAARNLLVGRLLETLLERGAEV